MKRYMRLGIVLAFIVVLWFGFVSRSLMSRAADADLLYVRTHRQVVTVQAFISAQRRAAPLERQVRQRLHDATFNWSVESGDITTLAQHSGVRVTHRALGSGASSSTSQVAVHPTPTPAPSQGPQAPLAPTSKHVDLTVEGSLHGVLAFLDGVGRLTIPVIVDHAQLNATTAGVKLELGGDLP